MYHLGTILSAIIHAERELSKEENQHDITVLLHKLREGDASVREELFNAVYQELRRLARRAMLSERPDHTLQPTALVHEAFLRLAGDNKIPWEDRKHFFSIAAKTMRRILVDHARGLAAAKRDGGQKADVVPDFPFAEGDRDDILAVDEALTRLELVDVRQSKVVELKYFAGLTNDEVAAVLGIDPRTVKREWQIARAWLHSQLSA